MNKISIKRTYLSLAASAAVLLVVGVGCEISEPCDEGDSYELGFCVPAPDEPEPAEGGDGDGDTTGDGDAGEGGAGGMSGDGDEPDEPVADEVDPSQLGTACQTQEECSGGTACAAEFGLPACIGQCGPGEPFEGKCPDSNPCVDFGGSLICNP